MVDEKKSDQLHPQTNRLDSSVGGPGLRPAAGRLDALHIAQGAPGIALRKRRGDGAGRRQKARWRKKALFE